MIEKKIKDSFNHTKLDWQDKERIYQNIMKEAASSPEMIQNKSRIERKSGMKRVAVACLAIGIASSVSVGAYAGYKWLSPSHVATELEQDDRLAKEFGKTTSELQIQENEEFRVVNLGVVSGKDIGHEIYSDDVPITDRTYIAVAIERKDKTPMTLEYDDFFISPLVQYVKPWQYNIFQQNGDSARFVKDGVLYVLVAGDNIEKFAANKVYLAVQSGTFYSTEAYDYDEKTGEVAIKPEFEGLNLLFDLQLDKSKADEKAAQAIIDQINKEDAEDVENSEDESKEDSNEESDRKIHWEESTVKDKKNNLTLKILDGTAFKGISEGDGIANSYYSMFPEVEGDGIDSITYTLDQGNFYKKKEVNEREADQLYHGETSEYDCYMSKDYVGEKRPGDPAKEFWLLKKADSSYTVKYEDQTTVDNMYSIGVTAKIEREDTKKDRYKEVAEELLKRTITATINYKDGHTVTKKLVFTKSPYEGFSHKGKLVWK